MNVKIARQTVNGMLQFSTIHSVLGMWKRQDVIANGDRMFAIVIRSMHAKPRHVRFYSEILRNTMFRILTMNHHQGVDSTIRMEYLRKQKYTMEEAREILNEKFAYRKNYVNFALRKAEKLSGKSMNDLDATRQFNSIGVDRLMRGTAHIAHPDVIAQIWAQCLSTPREVLGAGITPEQFYTYICEQFSSSSH